MPYYLYIGPIGIAILIFIYMRGVQVNRNRKLRDRLNKRNKNMVRTLAARKNNNENRKNEN